MDKRAFRGFFTLFFVAGLAIMACSLGSDGGPPRNAIVVEVVANRSLESWIIPTVDQFNAA
jgi:hypothetical protein